MAKIIPLIYFFRRKIKILFEKCFFVENRKTISIFRIKNTESLTSKKLCLPNSLLIVFLIQ
jgi:hypothetical protein